MSRWGDGEKYTCVVTKASIREPRIVILEVVGVHQPEKTNNDVEAVSIINTYVEFFPRGLNNIFPNLTAFRIRKCDLKSLSRMDLVGLENLTIISFPGNKLKLLPGDLFNDMPMLQWINFANNEIDSVSLKLFEPLDLENVLMIDFNKNRTINARYQKDGSLALKDLLAMIETSCITPPEDMKFPRIVERAFGKFQGFRANGRLTDFTIKLEAKDFKIHKIVLAAQSSVFEAMFTNSTPGIQIFKKIKSFSAETFEVFLNYFYTGEVREVIAEELFDLAFEFEVSSLKTSCAEIMLGRLNGTNALEVFNLAHQRSSEVLKSGAFAELKRIYPDLDDTLIDEVEIVNDFVKTKRRLDERKQNLKTAKDVPSP